MSSAIKQAPPNHSDFQPASKQFPPQEMVYKKPDGGAPPSLPSANGPDVNQNDVRKWDNGRFNRMHFMADTLAVASNVAGGITRSVLTKHASENTGLYSGIATAITASPSLALGTAGLIALSLPAMAAASAGGGGGCLCIDSGCGGGSVGSGPSGSKSKWKRDLFGWSNMPSGLGAVAGYCRAVQRYAYPIMLINSSTPASAAL
jgi:hypothetical protein